MSGIGEALFEDARRPDYGEKKKVDEVRVAFEAGAHIHLFEHVGGGCFVTEEVPDENARCDDHYVCDCGSEFFMHSDSGTHFRMPLKFLAVPSWLPEENTKTKEAVPE